MKLTKISLSIFIVLFSIVIGFTQSKQLLHKELNYYLPDISYNQEITTPEEFFGFQIGEWHISHDQLLNYVTLLAQESDRIGIESYARSHENRKLVLLTISSTENQSKIDDIREKHIQLTEATQSNELDIATMPIVVYQGYSVHGNESSGANAAILVAYYLAAGEDKVVKNLLNNAVILLDPCYNPDGFQRFSSWVNQHKSNTLVSDPSDREYNEVWPGGRTNHYWFDLNRDWLLLTHPESQGRIANFQKWKPNILTDHHEMGTNTTFFFQPGVPERTNPNTPQLNQDLTENIGKFHADALDKIGSMYYSKESFDDFYYGKGSSYPDIQGSIGILFEQASARGHYQESTNGILNFPFTVRNQVVTSLSTQEAAISMRKEILTYQKDFFQAAAKETSKNTIKAFAIPKEKDYNKASYFAKILGQHDIQVYDDNQNDGYFYIPTNQKQSRLIHIIFEKVTKFKANVFYDVSTWTFPLAFNINVTEENKWNPDGKTLLTSVPQKKVLFPDNQDKKIVAYAIEWFDWKAGLLLNRLLQNNVEIISLHQEFEGKTTIGPKAFNRGTLIIPSTDQRTQQILENEAKKLDIDVYGITTGFNQKGIMLGSPSANRLKKSTALMLVGDGINAYDAGEIWYHMDQRLEIPLTKVECQNVERTNLNRYNTIIMPDGSYRNLSSKAAMKIKTWVNNGGNLIAFKGAIRKLNNEKIVDYIDISGPTTDYKGEEYGTCHEKSAEHVIGGAIFYSKIDNSYPLFYGYKDDNYSAFKRGTFAIKADSSSLANPMIYTDSPLASGYASDDNINRIKNSAGLIVYGLGKGKIVCSVDNPLFRGYWIGGNKLFDNMIFHTSGIKWVGVK